MLDNVEARLEELRREGVSVMDVTEEMRAKHAEPEPQAGAVVMVVTEAMLDAMSGRRPRPKDWPWRSSPATIARVHNVRAAEFAGAGVVTAEEILELVKTYGSRCASCKATRTLAIDHIKPLCQGGKHERGNLQLLCRKCNSVKGQRTIRFVVSTT